MAAFFRKSGRELIAAKKIRKQLIADGIPEADIAAIEAIGPTDCFVPPEEADRSYHSEVRACIRESINTSLFK